jgi:hypothetical protein
LAFLIETSLFGAVVIGMRKNGKDITDLPFRLREKKIAQAVTVTVYIQFCFRILTS